jgi:hypothetical protein
MVELSCISEEVMKHGTVPFIVNQIIILIH